MHVQEQALSPKEEADRMEDEKQAAKLLSAALLGCDTRQNVADTLHCEKAFVCKMCV